MMVIDLIALIPACPKPFALYLPHVLFKPANYAD